LNQSILEAAIPSVSQTFLLNTQYRMRESIAGFSSHYFYDNLLLTAKHLENTGVHISFIDTAGSGFQEVKGRDGTSLQNDGELQLAMKIMESVSLIPAKQKKNYLQACGSVPLTVSRARKWKILSYRW
jgi:ATP-dependent RNA/DNA helicase IGHMBP2